MQILAPVPKSRHYQSLWKFFRFFCWLWKEPKGLGNSLGANQFESSGMYSHKSTVARGVWEFFLAVKGKNTEENSVKLSFRKKIMSLKKSSTKTDWHLI